jgi:UDP-N-acetylmuramate dehydrogenase
MKIEQNFDLTKLNTFALKVHARFFVEIKTEDDLVELLTSPHFLNNERFFLGGGSNILFTKNFEGIVILNKIKGIEILEDKEDSVLVRVMSGESWDYFVNFAVDRGLWGVENLAFIPGTVGAAPVQNIGAYGAELKDVLENVEVFEIAIGTKKILKNSECSFGYRDSIFKRKFKNQYFITAVVFRLSKIPKLNTSYKVLNDFLATNNIVVKNPRDISEAVTSIRKSKLPNPALIPNAGSFFKNIVLDQEKDKEKIKSFFCMYENVPSFPEGNNLKIPSAFLIEQCGPKVGVSWKGYRIGNVGVHDKQALVLVNYGGATGEELVNLAKQIISSVEEKFGLNLEMEVNLI